MIQHFFSPVNAATARGANLHGGVDAFRNCSAIQSHMCVMGDKTIWIVQTNLPQITLQLMFRQEVLIKDRIPKLYYRCCVSR